MTTAKNSKAKSVTGVTAFVAATITIIGFTTGIVTLDGLFSWALKKPEPSIIEVPFLGKIDIEDVQQAHELVNSGNKTLQERKDIYTKYLLSKKFKYQTTLEDVVYNDSTKKFHFTVSWPWFIRTKSFVSGSTSKELIKGYVYEIQCTYSEPLAMEDKSSGKIYLRAQPDNCTILY